MFNRKASDSKNKPDEVLQALRLESGQVVADIGAGGGYFALRFAEVVGNGGQIFATDVNPTFLEFVQVKAKEKGLSNIVTVLATEENTLLPAKKMNLIFMRNVCHHLHKRAEYFKALRGSLVADGRIAVIEYRGVEGFSFHRLLGHYVPKEKIVREMKEAGFQTEKDIDFLPEQSFTIYSIQREFGIGDSAEN